MAKVFSEPSPPTRSEAEVLASILEQTHPSRLAELSLTKARFERWVSLAHAMQNAAREYEPSGSVKCIDVFYCTPLASVARDREEWISKHLMKWEEFSRSRLDFHEAKGAHYTMLDPENVDIFAETLKRVLVERGV